MPKSVQYDRLWLKIRIHALEVFGVDWVMESYSDLTRRALDDGMISMAEAALIRQTQGDDMYFRARND